VLASLTSNEAGWLARHISDRIEKERASAGDEIESELKVILFSIPKSGECTDYFSRIFALLVMCAASECWLFKTVALSGDLPTARHS
jgi:hypothetical protein